METPLPSEPAPIEPTCAIYTRQSRSNRLGLFGSCEAQQSICAEVANGFRWGTSNELFDDSGESSETLNRPALQRLFREIEAGRIDRVLVYSVDRLTRKLIDLQKLLEFFEQHEVHLSVVTDPHFGENAASRMSSNIVAAVSEFQQELTRERMSEARTAHKQKGRRVAGRVPFGYSADTATKQLVVNPGKAEVVGRMFELAAAGTRPQELADRANEEGWPHCGGKSGKWTARQILKVLSNPIYAGAIRNGAETLPGRHTAIVTSELFECVRAQIEGRRSRAPGRSTPKFDWPLRGVLKCGQCGRVMSPSISGHRNKWYRYYRCRSNAGGRPSCRDVSFPAFEIEEFVRSLLSSNTWRQDDPDNPAQAEEFCAAWNELDQRMQRASLAKVLKEIRFNPGKGTVQLLLAEDAVQRLKSRPS